LKDRAFSVLTALARDVHGTPLEENAHVGSVDRRLVSFTFAVESIPLRGAWQMKYLSVVCLGLFAAAAMVTTPVVGTTVAPSTAGRTFGGQKGLQNPNSECFGIFMSSCSPGNCGYTCNLAENSGECAFAIENISHDGNRDGCFQPEVDPPETGCQQGTFYDCCQEFQCIWDSQNSACRMADPQQQVGSKRAPISCTDGL
jgi:hypothetical protein